MESGGFGYPVYSGLTDLRFGRRSYKRKAKVKKVTEEGGLTKMGTGIISPLFLDAKTQISIYDSPEIRYPTKPSVPS